MPSKASAERVAEMTHLRDWSIAIIRYMGNLGPPSDLFKQSEEAIGQAFDRGDLRGLRIVSKDVAEWAKGLSSQDQQKLDDMLTSRYGRGITDERKGAQKEIARILKRGQIDDENQYRLLMAHADEIYADESKSEELEKINSLLSTYEAD